MNLREGGLLLFERLGQVYRGSEEIHRIAPGALDWLWDRDAWYGWNQALGTTFDGRIQAVNARSSVSFSDGVMYPSALRGRLLRLSATRASSAALCTERSVPLGMY